MSKFEIVMRGIVAVFAIVSLPFGLAGAIIDARVKMSTVQ